MKHEKLGHTAWLKWGLLGWALTMSVQGCADAIPTNNKPCPCADGNVCCESGVCAKDQNACLATGSLGNLLEQARGDWTGYVENFTFASGADTIKLTFAAQSDGSVGGTVVFGQPEAPAVATDPNLGWPLGRTTSLLGPDPFYVEGFAYRAQNVRWDNQRLRFQIASTEAWQTWCGLQTPIQANDGHYGCLPPNVIASAGGAPCTEGADEHPIDCGKVNLCFLPDRVCTCTAQACTAATNLDISLDIALRDGTGDGSLALRGPSNNIRIKRTP